MSQVSILGFTPSDGSSSSYSSSIHWTILISPYPPSACKSQKSKSRFFHTRLAPRETQSDTVLFDMHNHQLRQQSFPIPVKDKSASETSSRAASTADSSETTLVDPSSPAIPPSAEEELPSTTTILNASSSHPLQLTLKIQASILPQAPQKLIPKLSTRLYNTPTYGPEDDWLRNALAAMHDGLLEPGFDVDQFVEYAGEAAKEYAMYEPTAPEVAEIRTNDGPAEQGTQAKKEVLELDYTAHIARNAQVKALLSHQHQELPQPTDTPQSPSVAATTTTSKRSRGLSIGGYKILGFRIAPSPTAYATRQPSMCGRQRYSFERQDDPYGGLM